MGSADSFSLRRIFSSPVSCAARAQGGIVSFCLAETRREARSGSIDRLSEEAIVTITRSLCSLFSFSSRSPHLYIFLSRMARQVP